MVANNETCSAKMAALGVNAAVLGATAAALAKNVNEKHAETAQNLKNTAHELQVIEECYSTA